MFEELRENYGHDTNKTMSRAPVSKNQVKWPGPLFAPGDASDRAYINLRDNLPTPELIQARRFVEKLWRTFYPHADKNFVNEVRNNFSARFWEMYLTCSLLHHSVQRNYVVSCLMPGPDVMLQFGNHRVWVEAAIVTDGDPSKPDSPVEKPTEGVYYIPTEKIVLRYANAISEKFNKYKSYCKSGYIGANDSFVVALCGSMLSFAWSDGIIPRFLEAIFPIGNLEIVFDRETKALVERRLQFRPRLHKASLSDVSTDIFLNDEYQGISAVLHSYANAHMSKHTLGADFILAHNPKAFRPLPPGLIPARTEYSLKEVEDRFELEKHEH